jgi:hypothetical protein
VVDPPSRMDVKEVLVVPVMVASQWPVGICLFVLLFVRDIQQPTNNDNT